jgi:hypothetical protein
MSDLSIIPSVPAASSPANYQAAKLALSRCEQVDECWEWNSKAAAVAEYARQAKDDSLIIMAQRIQARAIRRTGELLKAIPAGHWTRPGETRTSVARGAGMSRMQQRQAAQIAQLPAKRFEQLVESNDPPRPYKLAALGVKKRYPPGRPKGGAIGILQRRLEKAEAVVREIEADLAAAQEVVNRLRAQIRAREEKK